MIHLFQALLSCDNLASCIILVTLSTKAISICTVSTEVVAFVIIFKSKYIIAKANCYIADFNTCISNSASRTSRDCIPVLDPGEGIPQIPCSVFESLKSGRTWRWWHVPREGQQSWGKHNCRAELLRELGVFSPEKRRLA